MKAIKAIIGAGVVLVGLAGLPHEALGQPTRQDRPVVHLGELPIGTLGVPIGEYVTIEGVTLAGRLLNVDTVIRDTPVPTSATPTPLSNIPVPTP